MTTEIIVGVIAGVVAAIISDDILAWSPRLAERLVRFAAKKTPRDLQERCQQEWLADLSEIPGRFSKLLWALGAIVATININRAHGLLWSRLLLFGACICMLVVSPYFILYIAVLIKLDSPGPVFSRYRRYGLNLIGFRTTYVDQDDDERVTRVRRFLRRTSMWLLAILRLFMCIRRISWCIRWMPLFPWILFLDPDAWLEDDIDQDDTDDNARVTRVGAFLRRSYLYILPEIIWLPQIFKKYFSQIPG